MTTDYYDRHATKLAATYESLEAGRLNAWFRDFLPTAPACVLDIGAGSGRDAAWLASLGFDVVAVEPSAAMVQEARRFHPDAPIHWIEGDSLPGLERTLRVLLTDLKMEPVDGMQVLAVARSLHPPVETIVFTAFGAVGLMRPGGTKSISIAAVRRTAQQLCKDEVVTRKKLANFEFCLFLFFLLFS